MESGFAHFKAELWKYWILIHSVVLLSWFNRFTICTVACICMSVLFALFSYHNTTHITFADELINNIVISGRSWQKWVLPGPIHALSSASWFWSCCLIFFIWTYEWTPQTLSYQHYICWDKKLELFRKFIVTQHKCSVVWPDAQLVSRLLRPVLSEVNICKVIMLSGGLYEHMITSCDWSE